jgi:methionyl-tRNA synthetase
MEGDITARLERSELRDAFRAVFELASFANKTFQEAEPWRKRTEDPPAAELLIRELCYIVRDIAILIGPFMPASAVRIASFFGLTIGGRPAGKNGGEGAAAGGTGGEPEGSPEGGILSWADLGRDGGISGRVTSEVLFSRLEDERVDALRARYSGSQQDRAERQAADAAGKDAGAGALDAAAAFGALLDLRVARIVKIERHPRADKLYIETLEIAGEERVIVSGLVPFYKEEELLNKKIVVAYNLKPAKLRGVESRGMLLAASCTGEDGAKRVEVLDAGDVPTGTRVALEGAGPGDPPAEIDIDAFYTVPLAVRDYTVEAGGKALTLDGNVLRTRIIAAGEVH